MLRLTLKFKVTLTEILGTRELAEVKTYTLTDDYEASTSIEDIISSATNAVKANLEGTLDTTKRISVSCVSIVPEAVQEVKSTIEEPAKLEESADDFDGAMNPPEAHNVVEEIPEGFEKGEEVEESPFTNTYFDKDDSSQVEVKEETSYDEQEMFDKFLKLSFLTRQNLLIKRFNLLPEDRRGERHKIAFPIAVESAKEKGLLADFYEAINEEAAKA